MVYYAAQITKSLVYGACIFLGKYTDYVQPTAGFRRLWVTPSSLG